MENMFRWRISEHRQKLAVICGACLAIAGPTMGAGSPFDGTYVGKRMLVNDNTSAGCVVEDDASVTISGEVLTFTDSELKKMDIGFDPTKDGLFDQISNGDEGTISIKGKISGNTIDADVTNYSNGCKHHWHLTKEHH